MRPRVLPAGASLRSSPRAGPIRFHGNLNEYHRDTSLVANSWFSNNAYPIVPREHLIHNQFGGNVGGPITIPHLFSGKDKAFFFFDFNDSKIVAGSVVQRAVPTSTLAAGGITYDNTSGGTTTLSESQVSAYDPAGLGVDKSWVKFIAGRYPTPNTNIEGHSQFVSIHFQCAQQRR